MSDPSTPWRFYDAVTGIVLPGWSLFPDQQAVDENTPVGHVATTTPVDFRTQRIDPGTGEVVPYEPPPLPAPAMDEPTARAERDRRLSECDWVTARAVDLQEPVPEPWRTYRQALRDLTDQPNFPAEISWPIPPSN